MNFASRSCEDLTCTSGIRKSHSPAEMLSRRDLPVHCTTLPGVFRGSSSGTRRTNYTRGGRGRGRGLATDPSTGNGGLSARKPAAHRTKFRANCRPWPGVSPLYSFWAPST
ncbi:uncharacterized protein LOC116846030 [Odontomachus brunneus]|uniref:uncharacterized protein LOC116846030 n=1 Tax=Odontomachus brunneus TaxID=486640 RepID=UPI0013F25C8D|nr:uncharacterized protein LOC116846030 [Odontomachus brunneus]